MSLLLIPSASSKMKLAEFNETAANYLRIKSSSGIFPNRIWEFNWILLVLTGNTRSFFIRQITCQTATGKQR